jgi:hypothetical protein
MTSLHGHQERRLSIPTATVSQQRLEHVHAAVVSRASKTSAVTDDRR